MPNRIQPIFAIGIPARDEELLIDGSVRSVLASADALVDPSSVRVVVACDSCGDTTAEVVRSFARRDDRVDLVEGRWSSAGAARSAAIRRALDQTLAPASDVWIATTDADTVVPIDWLSGHARCWASGDHAVAGVVDLVDHTEAMGAVFGRHYVLGHDSHGHVHGANLGVRADAYLHVGGVPALALAEDHELWLALRLAGFTCRSSVAIRVATSARVRGRAPGGFADTLRRLIDGELTDRRGSDGGSDGGVDGVGGAAAVTDTAASA